ncbi:hypothetical protein SDC9_164923 [bioreactor metagenome]|uniref:Uncharacterized protein n=1 Tax=bioreactor metagenome TaxID=1076179 RepID=A0A645FSZ0_9ZZZZ
MNSVNNLTSRNQIWELRPHLIQLGIQFRKGKKASHGAMVKVHRYRIIRNFKTTGAADIAQILRLILINIMLLYIRNDHFDSKPCIAHFLNLRGREIADHVFSFFNFPFHRNT